MKASKPATYSLSFNASIIDKSDPKQVDFARGWESVEATFDDIVGHVSRGCAITAQYANGRRSGKNFMRAGFLAADVDDGMTLQEARDHILVRHHASLIHTTASHTPEKHRFRVIFLLSEPIKNVQDWADGQLGLAIALGSDKSVSDGARMFFGNTRAEVILLSGKMPPDVVADLVARGRDARAKKSLPGGSSWSLDSARLLGPGERIKLASGNHVRVDELNVGAAVHCPYHEDTNPSAYTVRSKSGKIGLHCSACKLTFWPDDQRDAYDFDAFERIFEARHKSDVPPRDDLKGFERFFPAKPRMVRLQERFLPNIPYTLGLTLVKSPKGSGKTEALASMIAAIRGRILRGDRSKDYPRSILLVGHRRTLIIEISAKLQLRCYVGPAEGDYGGLQTLAVCLDSLPKYSVSFAADRTANELARQRKGPFDLVILDESEQVLKHLLSETIEKRAGLEQCFDALSWEITHAKAVIALDADLGLLTAHAMQMMRPQDWESSCRIIYNAPVTSAVKRSMRLFSDGKRLQGEAIAAISQGQRCFITSNSKEFILNFERVIRSECGEAVVMRVVTGENSREEAVVRFVQNIRTDFLKVQVVLTTPSLGTGVDITFPNGECKVDRVFGFFFSMVNTHTDIDQQLCRVRNPGAVDVWIDRATFNFTCNVEVLKDDLARGYTVRRAVKGRRPDGMVSYDPRDPLLMLCAHVTALERASKNRLVELFCHLREQNGWIIERVAERTTGNAYDEARKYRRAERAKLLLEAYALTDADFVDLDERASKGAALSAEERAAHEKYQFERAVGLKLDTELVDMNLDGRLLTRIWTLAEIMTAWSAHSSLNLFDVLAEPTQQPKGRLQTMSSARMIGVLMRIAGLTTPRGFKVDCAVSVAGLSEFARVCGDNRTIIEEVFSEALRDDLDRNPIRQLNRFLSRVGLTLKQARSAKVPNQGKIRYYSLETKSLGRMIFLASSYSDVERQQAVAREENRGTSNRGMISTPKQGTEENTPYISPSNGLLSLVEKDD